MIQRELKTVTVRTFTTGKDSYGQVRQSGSVDRNTEMVIKLSSQVNVNDPRYIECDAVGITKDKTITPSDQIIDGDNIYQIKYTIPSGKYLQVILTK